MSKCDFNKVALQSRQNNFGKIQVLANHQQTVSNTCTRKNNFFGISASQIKYSFMLLKY